MTFNVKKCALLRFGPKFTYYTQYTIENEPVPLSSTYKNPGVLITDNLSWSPHIWAIFAKAYKSLSLIKRTVPLNNNASLKRVLYIPHLSKEPPCLLLILLETTYIKMCGMQLLEKF